MANAGKAVSSEYGSAFESTPAGTGATPARVTESVTQIVHRVRAEYDEMPGLCLTAPQAARLFGVDVDICEPVLAACVQAGFLREVSGKYFKV